MMDSVWNRRMLNKSGTNLAFRLSKGYVVLRGTFLITVFHTSRIIKDRYLSKENYLSPEDFVIFDFFNGNFLFMLYIIMIMVIFFILSPIDWYLRNRFIHQHPELALSLSDKLDKLTGIILVVAHVIALFAVVTAFLDFVIYLF